jgi:hypothetical protein
VKNLCEVVHTSLFIISTWELIREPMKIERCMNSSHPLTTNVLGASSRFVSLACKDPACDRLMSVPGW